MAREVRYRFSEAPRVKVIAECKEYCPDGNFYREENKDFDAKLIDLSQQGAKLASATKIPTGQSVRLKLSIEDLGIQFYVAGEVCWSKDDEEDSFLLGCALDTGLPDGLFDRLAEDGYLDRRTDPRFDEEFGIAASWELGGTQIAVTLRNFSRGGLCVLSNHPAIAGQELHLFVEQSDQHDIVAAAQWQLDVANGYLIGASFRNPQDFEMLKKTLKHHDDAVQPSAAGSTP